MDYGLLMSSFASQAAGRRLTQQTLLYESLRHAILNGDIRHGSQLVPTRAVAELHVSIFARDEFRLEFLPESLSMLGRLGLTVALEVKPHPSGFDAVTHELS